MISWQHLFGIFLGVSSIKYIVFGVFNDFNDIMFNYAQFTSVNNYLCTDNTTHSGASTMLLWALFGIPPHGNITDTVLFIDKVVNQDNHNDTLLFGINNSTNDELNNIIFWFDDNKYILVIVSIFSILAISVALYLILSLSKASSLLRWCDSNKKNKIIVSNDGTVYHVNPSYWNPSIYSFLLKIVLISYCNLSTVTIYQMIHASKDNIGLVFVATLVTLFVIIVFPLYILYKLYNNKDYLRDIDFSDSYGPLYLYYKIAPVKRQFMLAVIAKQLLYSIALNTNGRLNYTQNTLMMIINLLFLVAVIKIKPYRKKIYQYQAVMISASLFVMTLINYPIIYYYNDITNKHTFILANITLHVASIIIYMLCYFVDYLWSKKKAKISIMRKKVSINSTNNYDHSYDHDYDSDILIEGTKNYGTDDYVSDNISRFSHQLSGNFEE